MKSYALAFLAATLFGIAAVFSFVQGSAFRGAISTIAAISFILAGIHWRKKEKRNI
jgi:hypothetical protein